MEIVTVFFVVVNFKTGNTTGFTFFGFDLCNPAGPFSEDDAVLIQSWIKASKDEIAFCQNDRGIRSNSRFAETATLW